MASKAPTPKEKTDVPVKEKYFGSKRFYKHIVIALVILIILALVGVIVYLLWDRNNEELGIPPVDVTERGDGRGLLVTPENVDEIRSAEKPDDTYLRTRMTTEWNFATWDAPSENAMIENPEENARTIYFEVHLVSEDNEEEIGEMIYDSPYIPLGGRLTDFALTKPLSAGEYNAVVTYYLVDDDYEVITTTAVAVLIRVQN
ncbi:MAG: hypothetical protein FWF94_04250 [Oscillospiraceae bacterium]|nr:hypothetical protein [Oscillospiraceae bacterium]